MCLWRLLWGSHGTDIPSVIVEHHVVEIATKILEIESTPLALKVASIRVLNGIAANDNSFHGRMIPDTLNAVLVLLKSDAIDPHLQSVAVGFIGILAYHEPSRKSVVDCGALEPLQRVIEQEREAAPNAVIAIGNLIGRSEDFDPADKLFQIITGKAMISKVVDILAATLDGRKIGAIAFRVWEVAMSVHNLSINETNKEQLVKLGVSLCVVCVYVCAFIENLILMYVCVCVCVCVDENVY